MEQTRLTLSLDGLTVAALAALAQRQGLTLEVVIEGLLRDGLERSGPDGDPGLEARLSEDFARARSWPELQGRLRLKGYDLRGVTGDLTLVAFPSGTPLAPLRRLSVDEAALIRRFGRSFPCTARRWDWDLALDRPDMSAGPPDFDMGTHAAKG